MSSLSVGNKVPKFEVKNQNEEWITDESLLGQSYILFFYGQDDTPTCNKQVCSANSVFVMAKNNGYNIYGVSPDKPKKHTKFKEKYDLQIDLLSDPTKEMMYNFESYGPKQFMGKEVIGVYRKAYFIDEKGFIINILNDVVAAEQGNRILEVLNSKPK